MGRPFRVNLFCVIVGDLKAQEVEEQATLFGRKSALTFGWSTSLQQSLTIAAATSAT